MTLKISNSFANKLNSQVVFIAKDKPLAARKFKTDIIHKLKAIPKQPYAYRKSIYFDREDIRELIFKGYVIVFKINIIDKEIIVFGFTKQQNSRF